MKTKIIVVTGPTASGKTAFGAELAARLGGEVVSADSMLVYRGMDIGTAKPTLDEREGVVHHMIDVADPGEHYHAGRFRAEASEAIAGITARGRPAVVVGGTALYIKVLLEGLAEGPGRDDQVRGALEARWEAGEKDALYAELKAVDPDAAAKIHVNDRTRIVRALEIWLVTGERASGARKTHGFSERPYESLMFAMEMERGELYARINARVDEMVAKGLVDEVSGLLARGVGRDAPPMRAIGYAETVSHLLDGVPLPETIEAIKKATRHFARRQLTWMRKFDAVWISPSDAEKGFIMARNFLAR